MSEREDRRKELEHLRGELKCNGYPEWMLRDLSEDNSSESEKDVETSEEIPVVITYIQEFLELLRWVFGSYDIQTYFKPTNTFRQLLVEPKDPVSKENMVGPVYKIKCQECDAVYVGETERSLRAWFNEHWQPSSTTSEVAKHIHVDYTQHSVEKY